jgi:hypothetical protein
MPEHKRLSIGVLIIGSLYWDDRRQPWRSARLNMGESYTVSIRIRYGRRSQGRDDTYTMVFSEQAGEGRAKIVRCYRDIVNPPDLDVETNELWAAERNISSDGLIASDWGCVVLLCNPASAVPAELTDAWAMRVGAIRGYGRIPRVSEEATPVSDRGLLQMPWPVIVGTTDSVPLDLLIATANHPSLIGNPKSYPTPGTVAAAWLAENALKNNRVEYFRKNVANGISTFEDDDIEALLGSSNRKT